MRKLRVLSVVGTRPEIIRLSRVFSALDVHCDHIVAHTGQNYDYELNEIFFKELEIKKPDYFLDCAQGSRSAAQTIGNIIAAVDVLIEQVTPDAMLVLGDTNSALSVISAKRRKVPVFHMEAGNRCFDERVPEEINRRIVDHASDVNLTYSTIAREYLLREGLPPDRVIKTGSPMFEVIHHFLPQVQASDVLERLGLELNGYFVVSAHREENIDGDGSFERLISILNMVAAEYNLPIVVSTHPRTWNRIEQSGVVFHPNVRIMKPLGFLDYVKLQVSSRAVLSDSGTITEEASILGFSALNLRDAHERPEGMEEAAVMMVGLNPERVRQGLAILAGDSPRLSRIVKDYDVPDVSKKIVRIIHSYTDYVNRNVWRRY